MEPIEHKVQKFAVNVDKMGPKVIKFVVWLMAGVFLFFISFSLMTSRPIRLVEIDAIDYAQIARNISKGEGITTKFLRPISLRFVSRYENHPDLTNPPLYSLYLSRIIKIFDSPSLADGELDRKIIILGSGVFFLLSIPFFFWLASRMVRKDVAHLSVLFFVTNAIILRRSITALPDMFLLFLFILLMIALSYYDGFNIFKPALVGVLLGLCYLTRYSFGLFAVPLIIFFFIKSKRYKIFHVLMFSSTFLATIFPWLVRNYRLTGNPFFTLEWFKYKMFTGMFPGNLYWRSFMDEVFVKNINIFYFVRKIGMGVKANYGQLLGLTGNYLMPFFLVGILFFGFKKRYQQNRWLILVFFIIQLFCSSLFRPGANTMIIFFPFAILLAVDMFMELLDKKSIDPFLKTGVVVLFIGINILPTLFGFLPKVFSEQMYRAPKKYSEAHIIESAERIEEGSVIVSDIPWATAWYGNIVSLWMPWGGDDIEAMSEKIGQIRGGYFSPLVLRYPQAKEKIWLKFYAYIIRYKKVPEDNLFGWNWGKKYPHGDIFCSDKKYIKPEQ